MSMRKTATSAALAVCLGLGAGAANAALVFVGQWNLGDGITWSTGNAPTLSGQEAAAQLFGGAASDYHISTIGTNPGTIDFMTWIDRYGFGLSMVAENFKIDSNGNGIYEFGDTSAFVHDNDPGCFNRYSNPSVGCAGPGQKINYAFRDDARGRVPEPGTLALLGIAALGFTVTRRRAA